MKILVTGATGFVGRWLLRELGATVPEATLFGTAHGDGSAQVPLLPTDLTDPEAVRRAIAWADPTHVVHLAAIATTGGTAPDTYHRVNVEATADLLAALNERGAPCHVLLASSGAVYGTTARPAREDDPLQPQGAYARSKAAMEDAARPFASERLHLTIARAFNHTGPEQGTGFAVPDWARQIARIERGDDPPVVRVGNLDAVRDFLDVRDVVGAYRLLLGESAPWSVVNVASGQGASLREVLETLIGQARLPVTIEDDPTRRKPSDIPANVGDFSRLHQRTGWSPTRSLTDTVAETLNWWRWRSDER